MNPPTQIDLGGSFSEERDTIRDEPPTFAPATVRYAPGCIIHVIPELRKDTAMCRKCDPNNTVYVLECPIRQPINLCIAGEQVVLAAYQLEALQRQHTVSEMNARQKV